MLAGGRRFDLFCLAEPADDVGGRGKTWTGQPLSAKTLLRDIATFALAALRRARHYQIPRRRRSATIWPM